MHGGVSAPSCCAFIHRVAFKEVSGHRVLFKSVPENWGLSACGTTHEATSRISLGDRPHPEVRREGREPLQTKQGNRHTGRDQKARRGSDEVVPGILLSLLKLATTQEIFITQKFYNTTILKYSSFDEFK